MSTLLAAKAGATTELTRTRGPADTSSWRSVYRIGALAAVAVIALIPIQAAVFVAWPPPTTARGVFSLFEQSAIAGLLAFDLLLIGSWVLSALMFLGLYAALRHERGALITTAMAAEVIALAVYFASNTVFSMLSLSQQHAVATTDAERAILLAAGQAMLSLYTGTAFNVSYVLSGVAALLAAVAMLRSSAFGKTTAYVGIAYALLQVLPPTAGIPGMVVSLVSIVPMVVWLSLIARTLFRMGR